MKLILDAEHPENQALADALLNNFAGNDAPLIEMGAGNYTKGMNPPLDLTIKFVTKTKTHTFDVLITPRSYDGK